MTGSLQADGVNYSAPNGIARDDAGLILSRDPDLKSERGTALRVLLYLFGRDEAVKYLRTG